MKKYIYITSILILSLFAFLIIYFNKDDIFFQIFNISVSLISFLLTSILLITILLIFLLLELFWSNRKRQRIKENFLINFINKLRFLNSSDISFKNYSYEEIYDEFVDIYYTWQQIEANKTNFDSFVLQSIIYNFEQIKPFCYKNLTLIFTIDKKHHELWLNVLKAIDEINIKNLANLNSKIFNCLNQIENFVKEK